MVLSIFLKTYREIYLVWFAMRTAEANKDRFASLKPQSESP